MNQLLTLLVAGHRGAPRLPEGPARDQLFARLATIITACGGDDRRLRLLTGMAQGTDAAVADIAQRECLPLHLLGPGGPEPLTPPQQTAERQVWLGAPDVCLHADEPLSIRDEVALSFADLVIVLWDGAAPAGIAGGTVRLAFQAAQMMKPLLWLDTQGEVRLLDRTRLTPARLAHLRAPHPDPTLLRDLFGAPLDPAALPQALGAEIAADLHPVEDAVPGATARDSGEGLQVRRQHASAAARRWGQKHRWFSWLSYLAAALAVFAAVAGAIGLWPGGHGHGWAITELVLITAIVAGVTLAKRRDWHGRWISQRFIAEQLRYLRPCLPMLAIPEHFREPVWRAQDGTLDLISPELRYLQRSLSLAGLPQADGGTPYLPATLNAQQAQLTRLREEVAGQRRYHAAKHHQLHRQHVLLHRTALVLFVLTFGGVLLHFVLHAAWLLIFTAFGPALAAALHGIGVKLEIGRLAGQSHAAEQELAALLASLDAFTPEATWEGWLRLRQLTLTAAQVMSRENIQWQELLSHQSAELPA